MTKKLRAIHQFLPVYSQRDAIGTDTRLIQQQLRDWGFESEVFVEVLHGNSDARQFNAFAKSVQGQRNVTDVAAMYHFSIGSSLAYPWGGWPVRRWIRYHNVTPPGFFAHKDDRQVFNPCDVGRRQIPMVATLAHRTLADSAYNASELAPYTSVPTVVMPIFRDYELLTKLSDDQDLAKKLRANDVANILFVGRVTPSKAQTDLLQLLALAKKSTTRRLRLILPGGFFSPRYRQLTLDFARGLGLSVAEDNAGDAMNADLLILGSISDEALATLYRHSTVYFSMSEHEGYGVPLLESMWFDLPVIAHSSSAIPETLSNAGILVNKTNWAECVAALLRVVDNESVRQDLIAKGRVRRNELSLAAARRVLKGFLESEGQVIPS